MSKKKFLKKHENPVELDLQRIRSLEKICSKLERVQACQAIDADKQNNIISYEYFDSSRPLIKSLKNEIVWHDLGIVLAKIHKASFSALEISKNASRYSLQEFGLSEIEEYYLDDLFGVTWFHGDFWHGNIFRAADDSFIVIDPIPSKSIFNNEHHFANGLLDAATMYMSLYFVHPIFRQITVTPKNYTKPANDFLSAYLQERGINSEKALFLSKKIARSLAKKFINSYKNRLIFPLAKIKEFLALNTMNNLDQQINWK